MKSALESLFVVKMSTTKQEYIDNIFSLPVGGLFKYDPALIKFETVLSFLDSYLLLTGSIPPTGNGGITIPLETFTVAYVNSGSDLYATYGHSTIVVVAKVLSA